LSIEKTPNNSPEFLNMFPRTIKIKPKQIPARQIKKV